MRLLALLWLLLLGLATPAGAALLPPGAPLTAGFTEALVRAALPADSAFQITIDQPTLPLGNDATLATEVVLAQFQYDPAAGRFSGALVGTLDGRERFRLPIVGRAAGGAARAGAAPAGGAGRADRRGRSRLARGGARQPAARQHHRSRRSSSAARRAGGSARGRVLTERDLGPPVPGQARPPGRADLCPARPPVTALGVAQEDGALGDPVRVINAASRRQLQGVVSGPDEVAFRPMAAAAGPKRRRVRHENLAPAGASPRSACALLGGCANTIERLTQVGRPPELTPIENPVSAGELPADIAAHAGAGARDLPGQLAVAPGRALVLQGPARAHRRRRADRAGDDRRPGDAEQPDRAHARQ